LIDVKKSIVLTVAVCIVALTAWAAANDQNLTGWVSDSKCGAKGANAGHAACARKCVEAGEKPVLVTDKDQKVVAIANPDALSGKIGQHVAISGTMTSDGSLHVDKVQEQK
jgi:hypothetical protein